MNDNLCYNDDYISVTTRCTTLKNIYNLAFSHLESTDELEPRRLAESDSVN